MNAIDQTVLATQAQLSSLPRGMQGSTATAGQATTQTGGASDSGTAAKQIETVFLNELLRIMMEQTSFGKDRTVSTYLPAITSEMSKSIAEGRGIGLGDFILKGNALTRYASKSQATGAGSSGYSGQAATGVETIENEN